jgi:hypothetical protein
VEDWAGGAHRNVVIMLHSFFFFATFCIGLMKSCTMGSGIHLHLLQPQFAQQRVHVTALLAQGLTLIPLQLGLCCSKRV